MAQYLFVPGVYIYIVCLVIVSLWENFTPQRVVYAYTIQQPLCGLIGCDCFQSIHLY